MYYYDHQSAGLNLQSPQSDSTPWTLTLLEPHEIVMYYQFWKFEMKVHIIVRRPLNLKLLSNIKTKREIFKNNFGLLRISELYLPAINVHLLFLVIIESFWFGSSYLGNLDIQPHRHLALK